LNQAYLSGPDWHEADACEENIAAYIESKSKVTVGARVALHIERWGTGQLN
jgi:hypothetical protein